MHRAFVMDWICFSAELVERGCTAGWLRNVHVHARLEPSFRLVRVCVRILHDVASAAW